MMSMQASVGVAVELPLFPLQTVLFPGGLLNLKVFEARYLDLVSVCLREKRSFGVVALRKGKEVRVSGVPRIEWESVGCEAELIDVDSSQVGILRVSCKGGRRFSVVQSRQASDGLHVATVEWIAPDPEQLPATDMVATVKALANAIASMKREGRSPFLEPYHFTDGAWIANRWCELLPISLAARQQLMALTDAKVRLQLVDQFLRSKGVVSD